MSPTPPFADLSPILRAQRWVLAVMALFPERRGVDGAFSSVVTRPFGSALALSLLAAEGIADANDARRELVLLRAAARHSDPVYNLARASLIAARAHTAYLLPLEEAWATAVDCARALQHHCRGWFSMAEACLTGLSTHQGDAAGTAAREAFYALHARPDSPWNVVPWKTELPGVLPPPDVVIDRVPVGDTDGLNAALANAIPGQTIQLAPNRYVGPFHITTPGLTLEGGSEVFLVGGSDVDSSIPLVTVTTSTTLVGLTLRPGQGTAILANGDFLALDECHLEGGQRGLYFSGTYLQVRGTSFEDQAIALTLESGQITLHQPTFRRCATALLLGPDVTSLRADGGEAVGADTALACTPRPENRPTPTPSIRLRGFRSNSGILDFQDDGKTHLIDCHLAGFHIHGGELLAEGCQFSGTSHIEYAIAHLRDCHFLGSAGDNLVLGVGQFTTCLGGQMAGVESATGANVRVLGGRVRLDGVGLGPSAGQNLAIVPPASTPDNPANAHVELQDVALSSAGREALVIQGDHDSNVKLWAKNLRIRGSNSSAIVALCARLDFIALDVADIGATALIGTRCDITALGFGLRGARAGLLLEAGSRFLARDLVATGVDGPLVRVHASRVAIAASDIHLNGEVLSDSIFGASLASIRTDGLRLEQSKGELDRCRFDTGAVALVSSDLTLKKCESPADAIILDATSTLITDPTPPHTTAISPLLVAPRIEPFVAWGAVGDTHTLLSVARALAKRLGYLERLGLRETPQGLRVDGPLPVVARFAPALQALMTNPAALGLMLADALGAPSSF